MAENKEAHKCVKIRINNSKGVKIMTTLLIGRRGLMSSKETCCILRLRRLRHGKIPLGNDEQ